jgi:hypothetical protein
MVQVRMMKQLRPLLKRGRLKQLPPPAQPMEAQYDYLRLGTSIEAKVNSILDERRANSAANPYNHSGLPSRITEQVTMGQLKLDRLQKAAMQDLIKSSDFPVEYNSFKNCMSTKNHASSLIHSTNLKFNLIDYIKSKN